MRLLKPGVASSTVALLVLAACSGPNGTSATTPSSTGSTSPHGRDIDWQSPPAPPIPGAKPGGTLRFLSDFGPPTLDPSEVYYTRTVALESGLLIRSLTQYVRDPGTGDMVLLPDLATDLGTPSADFMTWTFTLRPGVRFENGRRVTPEDLKYGIERSFDRTSFPTGPDYSNQYFLDGDTYQGPSRSGDYRGVTIEGMTLTIRMAKPFPDMPYWGAFPAMSPIPRGKASFPATYKNHPLATGPYMLEDYTPGRSMTLVRNPYWDPATDPGRHQYIDTFDLRFTTSPTTIDQIMLADSGSAQTTITGNDVLAADYPTFMENSPERLVRGPGPCTYLWYPDNRQITDIRVRRALAYAYPYHAVWDATGFIEGVTALPALNVMPPGLPGRATYNPLPGHRPGSTDPAKARALLAQAGATNFPIRFAYRTDAPADVATKTVMVKALAQAGFDPHPVATTSADYSADIQHNPSAPVNVREVGWCSDWPSGSQWIPVEFRSTNIAREGLGWNLGAFSELEVDKQIDSVESLPLSDQPAAWNALDKLIQTRYFPVIVRQYAARALMRGSKVHGFFVDSTLGEPTWKDLWIG